MDQQLTKLNTTLHRLERSWNSPRATVFRIEALVVIAACFSFFLLILGSWRRWCKHWSIQKGVLGAYILSFSVVTYTIGSMQSSTARNEMFPVWALSLFAVLGCTNSITAYSLDDNKQFIRHGIQQVLYMGYTLLIMGTITSILGVIAAFVLFIETYQRNFFRVFACAMACESWNPNKQLADYMDSEQESNGPRPNPVTMEGYTYLVRWKPQHMKFDANTGYKTKLVTTQGLVTLDKIWQCDHGLLGSVGGASSELKDVSLSFALFLLLKRRFFGFHCAEAGKEKTREFVFEGLLFGEHGYERAFKVIEVELGFLYDFFYTKYAFVYHTEYTIIPWGILTIFCLCYIGAVTVIREMKIGNDSDGVIIVNTQTEDLLITLTVLIALALVQVLQAILYWTSNWSKVSLACDYVLQPQSKPLVKCHRKLQEFFTRFHLFDSYYWQHKLGQYSFLESYVYNSRGLFKGKVRVLPPHRPRRLCARINMSSYGHSLNQKMSSVSAEFSAEFRRTGVRGRVEGDPTRLSVQVKTAVIDSLRRSKGRLTKGTSSLQSNSEFISHTIVFQFRPDDTETHTILIWHIATCYCEMAPSSVCTNENPEDEKILKDCRDVATQLSKYCAYLVVFAPELLPGHQWNISELFNAVVEEARDTLEGAENCYQKINSLEGTEDSDTIFMRGVRLGKQLESISNVSMRWKVMADFWAELILYLAPSENVKEHIEYLAKGGEFITHLWALLFHAGIVKRDDEGHSV